MGETRAATVNQSPGQVVGLTFQTLLNPADCSSCASGALLLRAANFRVRTVTTVCTFSVEVTIVGAKTGSGCALEPDPSVVLCGPVVADITSPSTLSFTASVPLPANCCITGPAFLRIRLLSAGNCASPSSPFWGFAGPCISCRSFIEDPPSPQGEACADGWAANPVQWVDADCCDPTPSLHRTWGSLKTLYH
ncbi:MAG TPA: hypothetical protein VGK89_06020 [Candidatus Eisenbacteria bacterium]